MDRSLTSEYANVHRGVHYLSAAATERYEEARRARAAVSSTPRMRTRSSSPRAARKRSIWLPLPISRPRIEPGDEIVLSRDGAPFQHRALAFPARAPRRGAEMGGCVGSGRTRSRRCRARDHAARRSWSPSRICRTCWAPRRRLNEIVRLAHAKGVPVLADGCQGAVHGTVDVQALDVDFYAITGHKLYGPTGIGALYAKRAHLKAMRPYQGGGEMIREVTRGQRHLCRSRRCASRPARRPSCRRWACRGARLSRWRRARSDRRRMKLTLAARRRAAAEGTERHPHHRRSARTRARSFRSRRSASTRMIWPPFSTAKASRCAAAIIARSR